MSAVRWASWLTCGCLGTRAGGRESAKASADLSPFPGWDFEGTPTPPSHRSQPSDSSVDSRTPLAPPPSGCSSRWSPEPEAPSTMPGRLRTSTSRVAMYLRHSASTLLRGSAS